MRLVSASANPDKAAEIAAILEPLGIELVARPPQVADVVEDGDTLEANARLKGRPSAVPWTSTNRPDAVITTFMSTSARESST